MMLSTMTDRPVNIMNVPSDGVDTISSPLPEEEERTTMNNYYRNEDIRRNENTSRNEDHYGNEDNYYRNEDNYRNQEGYSISICVIILTAYISAYYFIRKVFSNTRSIPWLKRQRVRDRERENRNHYNHYDVCMTGNTIIIVLL